MQLTTPFSIHLSAAPRDPSEDLFGDSHLNSYLRFDEATDVFLRKLPPSRSSFDDINTAPTALSIFYKHDMADHVWKHAAPSSSKPISARPSKRAFS